jgi:16S rRNA (guanine1207-N2)-methyltransferase
MSVKDKSVEHYFTSAPKSEEKFGLVRTRLRGKPFEFLTSTSVFSKRKIDTGTRLLIEAMVLPEKGSVLDVGCGYGAVGIAAASFNPNLHVVLSDVNMRAVRLATKNIRLNKVPNAEAKYSHFYESVENMRFNVVLSNPPVSAGMETVTAIIKQAPAVMAQKASFQMVIRSKIGAKTLPDAFAEAFGNFRILARESGFRVLVGEL